MSKHFARLVEFRQYSALPELEMFTAPFIVIFLEWGCREFFFSSPVFVLFYPKWIFNDRPAVTCMRVFFFPYFTFLLRERDRKREWRPLPWPHNPQRCIRSLKLQRIAWFPPKKKSERTQYVFAQFNPSFYDKHSIVCVRRERCDLHIQMGLWVFHLFFWPTERKKINISCKVYREWLNADRLSGW